MKGKYNGNFKIIIGIFIGIIISGITVYAINSATVVYDNTTSGLTSTNVKDALDELYEKSKNWINPNNMETPAKYAYFTTSYTATWVDDADSLEKNVYIGQYGDGAANGKFAICIKKGGTQHCFRSLNNYAEIKHMKMVFGAGNCGFADSNSNFRCSYSTAGGNIRYYCTITANGSLACTTAVGGVTNTCVFGNDSRGVYCSSN